MATTFDSYMEPDDVRARFSADKKMAQLTVEVKPTPKELKDVLTRWEGAVSACERDGDDSPEAEQELAESRTALLDVLRRALGGCDDK